VVDPVERVEAVDAARIGDRDEAVELPVVLDRQRDSLLVREAPEDVRSDRGAEVSVQLGEPVLEHAPSLRCSRGGPKSLERGMRERRRATILALGRNEVQPLRSPLDEPLSPELALVCPELGARARQLLPDPGWFPAPVETPSAPPASWLQTVVLSVVCGVLTVTPLVLTLVLMGPHYSRH
jgi:hypothetical protein